jgi:hypothetical protein
LKRQKEQQRKARAEQKRDERRARKRGGPTVGTEEQWSAEPTDLTPADENPAEA